MTGQWEAAPGDWQTGGKSGLGMADCWAGALQLLCPSTKPTAVWSPAATDLARF